VALATALFFDGGIGRPRQVVKIVNWCGHSKEFVAWPEADGYWRLMPMMGEAGHD
jgi:hypothetical protein